jgi:hypothetical protein
VPPSADPPPLARTHAEADLYLSVQPCGTCGHVGLEVRGFSSGRVDGQERRWISAGCPNCGVLAEYVFRFPARRLASTDGHRRFGGDEASELLDPGQWLLLSEAMVAELPDDPRRLDRAGRRAARESIDVALAAVEETMKFLRDGEDSVSGYSFWSQPGYHLFVAQPWMFERRWLASQLTELRAMLARYAD